MMIKRIISENFENRMHELAGIIQENAYKIMKLGFSDKIANYLVDLDKKRGMFFADSLTRQYIKDNGLDVGNLKQTLESINQEELFNYIKSRENEIIKISKWIKQSTGQVNQNEFNGFNELASAAESVVEPPSFTKDVSFSPEVESYLRGLDYDSGIEIGVVALKGYFKHYHPEINTDSIHLEEMIKSINQKDFLEFLKDNENELNIIVVWMDSIVGESENDSSGSGKKEFIRNYNFKNLGEALVIANDWHTNLTASGEIKDNNAGKIIKRYSDGLYWRDLETNDSKDEAQAMGHCGREIKATTLFSLRDKNNEPHVTIAYNENNKNVAQVKGKENKKPIEKYMKYVDDLLGDLVKRDELRTFNWSYPKNGPDLNKEEVDGILSNMSAKAKFKLAKMGVTRSIGGGNLGVRY